MNISSEILTTNNNNAQNLQDFELDEFAYLVQYEDNIERATNILFNLIDSADKTNININKSKRFNDQIQVNFDRLTSIQSCAFLISLTKILEINDIYEVVFCNCKFENIDVCECFFNCLSDEKKYCLKFIECDLSMGFLKLLSKHKNKILILDLMDNTLDEQQLEYLSHFLENNSHLKELCLNGNQLSSYTFLGEPLKGCVSLEVLDLIENKIDDTGALALTTAIPHLACLKKIFLQQNQINDDGILAIADSLKNLSNSFLKKMNVKQNHASEKAINYLKEQLRNSIKRKSCLDERNSEEKAEVKKRIKLDDSQKSEDKNNDLLNDIKIAFAPSQYLLDRILMVNNGELRELFFEILVSKEYKIIPIDGDGDCLFASIALGLEASNPYSRFIVVEYSKKYPEAFTGLNMETLPLHHCLRHMAAHYILIHPKKFKEFISEDEINIKDEEIDDISWVKIYAKKIQQSGVWGGDAEILALMKIFQKSCLKRSIKIFDVNHNPTVEEGMFQTPELLHRKMSKADLDCIYLLRKNQNHYQLLMKNSPIEATLIQKEDNGFIENNVYYAINHLLPGPHRVEFLWS